MAKSPFISPTEYLMGRDKDYPLDMLQARNMAELLARVNWLLATLGRNDELSSGYRPGHYNKTIGGAKMSTHTLCAGVDLKGQSLGLYLKANPGLLDLCGLWLEEPSATPTWTHLDIKSRKNRIFHP